MKRWLAALMALALLLSCMALAEECEGWAVVTEDSEIREVPDSESDVLMEVAEGDELEYGGFTKYDEDHNPWYGVTWQEITGWIPGSDAELKWSTLY